MTCPTCGKDTARSEEWSTGQCDDCYLDDTWEDIYEGPSDGGESLRYSPPDEVPPDFDPECLTCVEMRDAGATFFPRHKASDRCRSGKHPHCTCDTCF